MIHVHSLTDFTISPWTKATASHDAYFTNERLKFNVAPLLDFISAALYSVGKPFVYRSTFTLLNVTNGIASLSYGLGRQPHRRLRQLHGLHFTFAFTTNWQYSQWAMPKHRFLVGPDTTFWGYTLRTSSNFMTIEIPRTVLNECGIKTLNVREMAWIYHLVGAFTKNFVFRNSYFVEHGKPFLDEPISDGVLFTSLPMLFKFYNFGAWHYSFHAWRMISNTLSPRCVNDRFCLHYLKHLTPFYKKYTTDNVIQIEAKMESIVKQMVANKDPRLETVLHRTQELDDDYFYALFGGKK